MKVRVISSGQVVTRDATLAEIAEAAERQTAFAESRKEVWRSRATLSRFEMGEALIASGILDHAQTKDFLGGTIPAPLAAMISFIPEEDRPVAERATIGAQYFERNSPLWSGIAAAEAGPTDAEIDALFGWDE